MASHHFTTSAPTWPLHAIDPHPIWRNEYFDPFVDDVWSDKSGCQYCDGFCHGGCREYVELARAEGRTL